jgi:hypothetical protein
VRHCRGSRPDPGIGVAAQLARVASQDLGDGDLIGGGERLRIGVLALDERDREGAQPLLVLPNAPLVPGEHVAPDREHDQEQHRERQEREHENEERLDHDQRRPRTAWTRVRSSCGLKGFRR